MRIALIRTRHSAEHRHGGCGSALCFGIEAHIIEPAGFPTSDRAFRRCRNGLPRSGDDCAPRLLGSIRNPGRREQFLRPGAVHDTCRTLLFSSTAYAKRDILLFGRESAGVPEAVHAAADIRIVVPDADGPALTQRRHDVARWRPARLCGRPAASRRWPGRDDDGLEEPPMDAGQLESRKTRRPDVVRVAP